VGEAVKATFSDIVMNDRNDRGANFYLSDQLDAFEVEARLRQVVNRLPPLD
jgi:hypothetical protein